MLLKKLGRHEKGKVLAERDTFIHHNKLRNTKVKLSLYRPGQSRRDPGG
jgi:hypothetical protein